MRNLASVCTIEKVWALEGKDKVQGASFKENAYEVMVSKDIQPGMLVAFIQEGSILPEINAWEFLRKRCYRDSLKGFLIKPQKFGTIRSWGLAVPLDELPIADERVINNLKPGDDLTDLLEIRKYEPEEDASPRSSSKKAYPKWVKFCLSHTLTRYIGRVWQKSHQKPVGGFPIDLISRSDETTIQNMKGVLEKFAESKVDISCVAEDTLIDTVDGQKTIKEIVDTKYSGEVLSYNEKNSMIEPKKILSYSVAPDESDTEWFEIELENGKKLQITGNDNVYLPELKCYRKVKDLNGDEKLLLNL